VSFNPVATSGGFTDAKIAKAFAPCGIQALGGNIFVTYAKQDAAAKNDVPLPAGRTWTSSRPTASSSHA
jgi:hypothetical protein